MAAEVARGEAFGELERREIEARSLELQLVEARGAAERTLRATEARALRSQIEQQQQVA